MKTKQRGKFLTPKWFVFAAIVLLAGLGVVSSTVQAQVERGTIAGTVLDPQGSAVPKATIVVTNVATGVAGKTQTGDTGDFVVPNLIPGEYSVTASIAGFKTTQQNGVSLQVNGRVALTLKLEVGQVQEHVQVTAGAPLVQTESSEVQTLVTRRDVAELPLNGRTVFQLAPLVAGVNNGRPSSNANSTSIPDNARAQQGLGANGQTQDQNTYLLDGVFNNQVNQGLIAILPPLEAIQEFSVETSNFMPEIGRGGMVMNVTLKSGTNKFHGSAFDFLRNSSLDAANYFDAPTPDNPERLPHFVRNQFGGTFGGPIIKDKTFFFVDYQGTRENKGETLNTVVPTAASRAGDFSGTDQTIFDPATACGFGANPACAVVGGNPVLTRTQFAGNKIDPSRFNSAAVGVLQYIPLPNSTIFTNGQGIFHSTAGRLHTEDSFDIKVDHQLTSKDSLNARFSFGNSYTVLPGSFEDYPQYKPAVGTAGGLIGDVSNPARSADLEEIHTFSPHIQNEFRAAYIRSGADATQIGYGHNYADQLGIPNVNITPNNSGFPGIHVQHLNGIGESAFFPLIELENVYQALDNVTFVRGSHTMKAGVDIKEIRRAFTQILGSPAASFSFGGDFTSDPQNPNPSATGNGIADFLLGIPDGASITVNAGAQTIETTEFSGYWQDTWRATPNLTLNYGVRYDLFTPQIVASNKMSTFDFQTQELILPNQDNCQGVYCNRSFTTTDWNNFSPRFGFAYKMGRQGVVRASYGMFYAPEEQDGLQMTQNPPFVGGSSFVNEANQGGTQVINRTLDMGLPPGNALIPITNPSGSIYFVTPRKPTAYTEQWSLGVEREIATNLVAEIAYVGNSSMHLRDQTNPDQPLLGNAPVVPVPGIEGSQTSVLYPFHNTLPNVTGMYDIKQDGRGSYNGLQASLTKRFSHGLSFMTNYTWSHMIQVGYFDGVGAQDYRNPDAEKRNGDSDMRHRFVFSGLYELPFGHGKPLAGGASGIANGIIGGWQLGTATIINTGTPFTVGGGYDRPNQLCNGNLSKGQRSITHWFDANCYAVPDPVTDVNFGGFYIPYGNTAPNTLFGPGQVNVDFSLFKTFMIGENKRLEFRGEAFNAFNTPHFSPPDAWITDSTVGQIFSTASDSRQIQLVLKFSF